MAKYSESVIEEIKAKASLVEVVSKYLTLNKKGDRYWGLCPFHNEKTPSFSVLPEKGFYHCFGCGKSGSLFDFVMEMEHLNFPEAVKYLGDSVGVVVQEETEGERKRRAEMETLKDLYDKLAASFHYILKETPKGEKARAYLEKRKISFAMQEKFLLGYAPDDPDWLYRFLSSKHYSDTILALSGLFSKNNQSYPLFRDRLMFPIRDWQGNCVAFGGRDLSGTSRAKYINTPETMFYKKREVLFGMHESLPAIKKSETFYLCEGNFDVVAMHQAGLDCAMAPLGTAFTAEQGRMVRRYAKNAFLLFDSDRAGQEATKKTLTLCERLGFESRVITLEGAKDPAECMELNGEAALAAACSKSRPAFDHLVHSALNLYDGKKPKGKLQVLNEVKPYLDAVDSEIVRQGYLRDLSDLMGIDEATLMKDYRPPADAGGNFRVSSKDLEGADNVADIVYWSRSIDLYALTTLMNNRDLFAVYRKKVRVADLNDELAVELYTILEDASRAAVTASDEIILDMIRTPSLRQMVALSFQSKEFTQQATFLLDESVYRITMRRLEAKRRSIEQLIRIAEKEGSVANDTTSLLLEKKSLDEEIAKMRKPEHV